MWVKSCHPRWGGRSENEEMKNDLLSGKPGKMDKGKHKWKIIQDHNPSQILKSKILWKFSFLLTHTEAKSNHACTHMAAWSTPNIKPCKFFSTE